MIDTSPWLECDPDPEIETVPLKETIVKKRRVTKKKQRFCYLLQSELEPDRFYVGETNDDEKRLKQHNGIISGGAAETIQYRPWKMIAIVSSFADKSESR